MDGRILKGSFYLVLFFIALSMCSCTDYTPRVMVTEIYVSKTADDIPVSLKAYRDAKDDLDRKIIDEALDKIIAQKSLKELADRCEATVMDLKEFFRFSDLEIALQMKHNEPGLWPNSFNCPVIINRPEI